MEEKYVELGKIVNTSGLKGLLKIVPYTDDITRFDDLETIYVEKDKKLTKFNIEMVRYHKNMVIMKLKGIDDINDAEQYKNTYIKILRSDLKKLPKDTYYIIDLIGLEVYEEQGKLLGKLEDIYNTGSNDIYVVKDDLGKSLLLPAISDVIKQISLEEKKIIVHLIEGLI